MKIDSISLRGAGTAVYTKAFPIPDIMAFQFNFEDVDANGSAAVVLQHCDPADEGENWVDKASLTLSPNSTLTAGAANIKTATDSGSTPALGKGRLKITPTTTAKGRVDCFVSGRAY